MSSAPMDPAANYDPATRMDRKILLRGLGEAIGVALDLPRKRMAWTNLEGDVGLSNIDGSDNRVLLKSQGIYVFADTPWHVLTLAIAVIWGNFQRIPARLALPLVFYPLAWPILLVGFGVRRKMIGKADLFAVGIIGVLFPISAVVAALLGFEFWRRWWVGRRIGRGFGRRNGRRVGRRDKRRVERRNGRRRGRRTGRGF